MEFYFNINLIYFFVVAHGSCVAIVQLQIPMKGALGMIGMVTYHQRFIFNSQKFFSSILGRTFACLAIDIKLSF